MKDFFTLFSRSLIGLLGAAITTVSALIFITMLALSIAGFEGGPYTGILSFIVVPTLFIVGLILIPLGAWRTRRKEARGITIAAAPVIDFNVSRTRKVALIVLALTVVNISVVAAATYKGVEVMDSTQFCGGACHQVMSPEFTTYSRSPHSRVKCTECHIGSGASWFVKSKLSGSWQLISVALGLYPKPIPTPVHNLRPARETCEQCHWPTKFIGERLRVRTHFDEDETQTEKKNVLLLNVGGIQDGKGKGIHWHVDPKIKIRYKADERRQKIYDVELTDGDGKVKSFKTDAKPEAGEKISGEWRTMDCIDCHNRPTHVYRYSQQAMDLALEAGEVDKTLPFVKREGMKLIEAEYKSHDEAAAAITSGLKAFYEKEYPELAKTDAAKIDKSAAGLVAFYKDNVFPQMNIKWGSYPNFAYEHVGCFRCHDKQHATESGEKISKSCSLCHGILASEETEPEILDVLHP